MPFEDAAEELYSSFSDIESIIESILFDFRTIENQADNIARKLTHVEQSVSHDDSDYYLAVLILCSRLT